MQVNPLPTAGTIDSRLIEGLGQVQLQGKVVASPERSAPAPEKPAAAPSALPEPERVSVSIDPSREFVYRFVDAKSGEVISQTPSEAVLKIARGIQDQLSAEAQRKIVSLNVRA